MSAEGLDVLLAELGVRGDRHRLLAGAALIAAFELSFLTFSCLQAVVERALGWSPVWVLIGVWVVWTVWHSWWFPRSRRRYLEKHALPYRSAFIFEIYPWVTVGFSQMWRPLFNGDTLELVTAPTAEGAILGALRLGPVQVVAVVAMSTVALAVMVGAIRTLGIANAAFVAEFREAQEFEPVREGIYGRFLHPLFWSGILFSVALAVLVWTRVGFLIAAVNLVYGVVYSRLESRRLEKVFGEAYAAYSSEVSGLPVNAGLLGRRRRGR